MASEKFIKAFYLIDQENGKDSNIETYQGESWPKELLYSHRVSECLDHYKSDASEALQLAARAHHICRWEIPRSTYPMDRTGYHNWRNRLKVYHAEKTASILKEVGYTDQLIQEVQHLIQKKHLRNNADTQVLEDVICLVFIKDYLKAFAENKPKEKVVSIIQKTWNKMTEEGQNAALKLDLDTTTSTWVNLALSSS